MRILSLPNGEEVEFAVRRSARARNMLLHVGRLDGTVELVLPRHATLTEGLEFAREKGGWVQRRLDEVIRPIPFADGGEVPVLGVPHVIRHIPRTRGAVRREGNQLIAPGHPEHLPRRIRDWLCSEAKLEIGARARTMARRIDHRPRRIVIRDQRTRWGSCSHEGNLNFSWRLIMAPEPVLDYVVAHEVAHLEELNHGRKFWALVDDLCPEAGWSRRWLVDNGVQLHRYG